MTRCIMGFQIFLLVVFCTGIRAQQNQIERCLAMVLIEDHYLHTVTKIGSEEELKGFCSEMSTFFTCIHEVAYEKTGYTVNELAIRLKGTDVGKGLTIFVNIENLLVDICTEGTQIRKDYLENMVCFQRIGQNETQECQQQSAAVSLSVTNLQDEERNERNTFDAICVGSAYMLGCFGVSIQEQCGDPGFKTYKEIIKRIGFFKSGVCSTEIMQTIKTSLEGSLEISDSRKNLYRAVLEQRRRK